ncbi:MAG: YggT family protein [Chloroflexi bacterium]|nr:MAG: YggT family protein [Chloroflexota bacterium]
MPSSPAAPCFDWARSSSGLAPPHLWEGGRTTAGGADRLSAIAGLLVLVLQAFLIVVLIRIVFSWLSPYPTNPVSRLAFQVTEPILAPIRRRLPPLSGIDLSPLVVWLVVIILIGVLRTLG